MTMESSGGGKTNNGLGSFLDSKPVKRNTKGGSATVSGDRVVEKVEQGEIYIRADGKKVRKVKRSVSRKNSDGAASVGGASISSSKGLGSFLDSSVPKGGKKMSGSATVTGAPASSSSQKMFNKDGEEMEIYIRPDGKKVRRIKRTKSSRGLGLAAAKDDLKASASGSSTGSAGGLSGFLGASASTKPKMSGSATVTGGGGGGEGEIIIRADGKKVRRVRKTVSSGSASSAGAGAGATPGDKKKPAAAAAASKNGGLGSFLDSSVPKGGKRMSGSATVTGAPVTRSSKSAGAEGEVYINKDGKKVRRVKRSISSSASAAGDLLAPSSSSSKTASGGATKKAPTTTTTKAATAGGLAGFLDSGDKPKSRASGSATVCGSTPTKLLKQASSKSADEGEIYIRADGKKVRRVKRNTSKSTDDLLGSNKSSSSPASKAASPAGDATTKPAASTAEDKKKKPSSSLGGLGGFLDAGAASKPKMSGSATVAGDRNVKQESEVYIRADGKKVRRVRKTVSKNAGEKPAAAAAAGGGVKKAASGNDLLSFLGSSTPKKSMSGSATVTGAPVRSSKSADAGEIYINKDGKKVRRVRRSVSGQANDLSKPSKPGLGGFLDKGSSASKVGKASGSATVCGSTPATKKSGTLSASSSKEEGEIYIRPDGKKVRRVKRNKSSTTDDLAAKKSLGNFLGTNDGNKSKMSGSATVAGDQVVKRTDEGEIVIRADGKKVLRRKKQSAAGGSPANGAGVGRKKSDSSNTEVYRRADGKLVRRVKKSSAGDLAGFFDSSAKKNPQSKASGSATVCGDEKGASDGKDRAATVADLLKSKSTGGIDENKAPISKPTSADGDSSQFAMGGKYRAMLEQGMAPGAVKAKMVTDGVNAKVISVVMDEATQRRPSTMIRKSSSAVDGELTEEQEGIATSYRKMLKMGLPDDVVRHKMTQDGIDAIIIKAVVGDEPDPALAPPTSENEDKLQPEPTPEAAPTPVADDKEETKSGIQLSHDEEAIATTYRKMLKMGLPNDAVKHKMQQDGVEAKIIAAVLGEPWSDPAAEATKEETSGVQLSDDDEATAGPYRKMLKMGLPPDSVRHKMQQDGIDAKIVAAVLGEAPPDEVAPASREQATGMLSGEEEEIAGKYRRMFKMGLPPDAIRHKMVQDGVEDRIIAAVMGDEPPPESAVPTTAAAQAPVAALETTPPGIQLSDDEEAIASKYRRMFKMGLPQDAIRHKMVQDGVEANIIAAVMGDDPPPESTTSVAPAQATSSALAVPSGSGQQLSEEDKATVEKYRKMLKMGLPKDAVKHKMLQDGVSTDLVNLTLTDEEPATSPPPLEIATTQAPTSTTQGSQPHGTKAANAVAYIVVVSDDPNATPLSSLPSPGGKAAESANKASAIDPLEKFAVKVNEAGGQAEKTETNFMTLDELAAVSGQSKGELEKLVTQKRERAESPPRFVLAPVDKKQPENLYEVAVPKAGEGGGSGSGPTMTDVGLDPKKNYREVKDGQEVVDTKLADAAKAVSALGDLDMKSLLEKLQRGDMEDIMRKLQEAEKRQKKLEKQLAQAGVAIAEDIDYAECQTKVAEIAKRMGEIGGSDIVMEDKEKQNKLREEYFKLEQAMEKYNSALMLTEEYQNEQDRLEKKWEEDNEAVNMEALRKIRRHMPVKIRHMSEAELTNTPSPNGKFLPKPIAKKFKRTNVLQCLRINPDDLELMHPATLENMRVTGLTLTERRACYAHLKVLGPKWEKNKAEKMAERKWTWFKMMKNNFKDNLAPYQRHVEQFGPPGNHVGCTLLGKQCPIKADKMIDYDGDYGWTPEAEYEVSEVRKADVDDPGAKAMQEAVELAREKKANERADLLKKHYKGKLLQVSKANGSCENMDESMDKMEFALLRWIETKLEKGKDPPEADKTKELANFTDGLNELKLATLDFAQRSGMQMSGKKKAGGDGEDIRSFVEGGLATEVFETSEVYFKFIKDRMKEMEVRDTRVEKTTELIQNMLKELNGKNIELFKKLGVSRPERSRKLRDIADLTKEVEEKMKPKEEDKPPEEEAPMGGPPGGGRGGRGGLLDAIGGGRGRGRGGGRGGLLDAISAGGRGKKGRGGGGDGGGRGGLMAAIAARGSGRGGRGGGAAGGGRGGLMAAIAARGGGGD